MGRMKRCQEIQNSITKLSISLDFVIETAIEYNEAEDTVQCRAAEHLLSLLKDVLAEFMLEQKQVADKAIAGYIDWKI
jgi:hypothetical protein